ncbi:GNAT family N-acetyltransferase [Streptomyces sp. 8N706]|uniref:GNAT family N-acetyltransferase n=1 Tax=Streptomyces sp. 8N706 TaxID=3457416 RepID=UPI003FD5BFA1
MTLLTTAPIRRLSRTDVPRCLELSTGSGWPREGRAWQLLLAAGTGYGIDDPDGDGLIGCLVLTRYGSETACAGTPLVDGRHAAHEVGHRLMTHALEEAEGTPVRLVTPESGRPLYEQLGFTPLGNTSTRRGRFRAEPGTTVTTRPATAADLPAILRLDAEVFGADRTHLLTRLPAFAEQVRVVEEGDRLLGFAAAWRSGRTTVIGPVVAEDTAAARRLIADLAVGTDGFDDEVRLDVDARHPELEDWLESRGVTAVTAGTVMVHGARDLPGDHRRRFAPLMAATG